MLHKIESITDVRFYDLLGDELLHVPDPQFDGMQLKLPEQEPAFKTAAYMIVTFDDGTTERVNLETGQD